MEKKQEPESGQLAPALQCYLCGRSVPEKYAVVRIEPRLATRYHGKPVKICIYCAEDWDEQYPESVPTGEQKADLEALLAEEQAAAAAEAEKAAPEPEQPLTKRQAERLAWYSNVKPVRGYDVKSAILRDDALGAVAQAADRLGLSYGYYIARQGK